MNWPSGTAGESQQRRDGGDHDWTYVVRRGGKVTYRDPVADDAPALRMAVQRDLTRELIVITATEPGDASEKSSPNLARCSRTVSERPRPRTGIAVVENRPVALLPESTGAVRGGAVQLVRPSEDVRPRPTARRSETRAT